MKTKICCLLAIVLGITNLSFGQTIYEDYDSYKLGENRQIKIQLPRNYEENEEKSYPLFVVLDGDYLFEAVAGNVDYYSYWEDMPEAIIVGINQVDTRNADIMYSEQNSLPIESGSKFFEFISMELIPYLRDSYRLAEFTVAVGHGETANFINYYVLKEKPLFHAYINISPFLAPDMLNYIPERLQQIQSKTFYYLATSDNDLKAIKEDSHALNTALSSIDNANFIYAFDNFESPTHYSNPAHALPYALEKIFYVFQPISKKEYLEKILPLQTSPVTYLLDKYQTIKDLFGLDKQILINDFKAIDAAIEKNKTYEHFEELGKIARKQYPETLLGSYYLARFYEENGKPKKAMQIYRSAYVLEEIAGITKDLMLEKADEIKADFGY
ncbi:MAG: esterase [Bacteroidia bacterium]|nr:esterase [Bacteroidia bacterium]NND50812.1 esterase [Flavobacteriaceae bacterium]